MDWLRRHVPALKVRVVNVVDLMTLPAPETHPHGLDDATFDSLFTSDRPVVFAYHGYPWLIHRLTYKRTNHGNFHVHGFIEEGTTTTPFDMCVLNRLDRFHLALAALQTVPHLGACAEHAEQALRDAWRPITRMSVAPATTCRRCGIGSGRTGMRIRIRTVGGSTATSCSAVQPRAKSLARAKPWTTGRSSPEAGR